MTYQDLASQLPYVLAPILLCSAFLKSGMETFASMRTEHKAQVKGEYSLSQTFSPVVKTYVESSWGWRLELALGLSVILFCPYSGPIRAITQVCMAAVFFVFSAMCFVDLKKNAQDSCRCFGNLSKKPPRLFSCTRNGILSLAALLGLFASPASLSVLGLVLAVVVLGAILFEEIH